MDGMSLIERPSPNFDARTRKVDLVVLHYTGMQDAETALARLTDPSPKAGRYPGPWAPADLPADADLGRVSAHYVVAEDGRVFRLVDETNRAWHAGVANWDGESDVNARSIGIEIVNGGHDFGLPPYTEPQLAALEDLLVDILARHALGPHRVVGHSDVIMGSVTCTREAWPGLKSVTTDFGQTASPDDCYLAARGLRTMAMRLPIHHASGVQRAEWIAAQPEVERVLHPALPGDPGHALWKRDFKGACGLFGVVLKPMARAPRDALLDALTLYGIGASWGGFESLAMPFDPNEVRTATRWPHAGPCFRVHAGLEHIDDLIADMAQGFAALRKALTTA
jgi:hypothetical protein